MVIEITYRIQKKSWHSTLFNILEKWKNTLDKGGFVCAMFMDL